MQAATSWKFCKVSKHSTKLVFSMVFSYCCIATKKNLAVNLSLPVLNYFTNAFVAMFHAARCLIFRVPKHLLEVDFYTAQKLFHFLLFLSADY